MVTKIRYKGQLRQVLEDTGTAYKINSNPSPIMVLKQNCEIVESKKETLHITPNKIKGGNLKTYGVNNNTYNVYKDTEIVFTGKPIEIAVEYRITMGMVGQMIQKKIKFNKLYIK